MRVLTMMIWAQVLFLGTAGVAAAEEVVLYDVGFDSPEQSVGVLVATDTGPLPRNGPSKIEFGDPTVVASEGPMMDQPCLFGNGTAGYDQIVFSTGKDYPAAGLPVAFARYRIEVDVCVEQLGLPTGESPTGSQNAFTILLDSPIVRTIHFGFDWSIRTSPRSFDDYYPMRTPLHVVIEADIVDDVWSLAIDGELLWKVPMDFEQLQGVRFNLDGAHADDSVAIDNVRIVGIDALPVATEVSSWGRVKATFH